MSLQDENNLIVKIPLKVNRYNPYNNMAGEMNNIVGLIEYHGGYADLGFAYLIDMDYKDKGDQIGDWAVKYDGEKEDFKALCKGLKIPLWEM